MEALATKGFNTGDGYMGLVDGEYILFASESDYYEYISNGSACNSKSYSPSYVLLAMGIPIDQIESSVRISWGHDITIDEIEKSFQNVIEAAKGLVW